MYEVAFKLLPNLMQCSSWGQEVSIMMSYWKYCSQTCLHIFLKKANIWGNKRLFHSVQSTKVWFSQKQLLFGYSEQRFQLLTQSSAKSRKLNKCCRQARWYHDLTSASHTAPHTLNNRPVPQNTETALTQLRSFDNSWCLQTATFAFWQTKWYIQTAPGLLISLNLDLS